MIAASERRDWSNDAWLEIGLTLLTEESRTLTAPEIARRTGRNNVKRSAMAMVAARLLEERSPAAQGGRGRRATIAFHLPEHAIEEVRAQRDQRHPRGLMRHGQQIVLAEVGEPAIPDLFGTLAASQALVRASWFALLDGDPQALAIVFDGPDAAHSALDLMTELLTAKLRARRTALSSIGSIEELTRRNKQRTRAAWRSETRPNRMRSGTG